MADDQISNLLSQYYGQPELLGEPAPLPNVMPREMRRPQLGQHNFIDRVLSAPGQPTVDALQRGLQGLETPQGVALSFLENGPVGPLGMGMARIPNPIRAFHGSPHQFDQFDPAHIGRGEGAQAYGHGLYFAENPNVAQMYRDGLGGSGIRVGGEAMDIAPAGAPAYRASQILRETNGDVDAALARLHQGGDAEASNVLRYWQSEGLEFRPPWTYEVNLHAQPGQFLDWDRPLSQQSATVQDALHRNWLAHRDSHAHRTGHGIYADLERAPSSDPNVMALRPQEVVSRQLHEAGIPGIRYLDQGSRPTRPIADLQATIQSYEEALRSRPNDAYLADLLADRRAELARAQQGTSNYVVFNPEIIEILRRYGIAAPVTAASVLSQYGGEEPAQ